MGGQNVTQQHIIVADNSARFRRDLKIFLGNYGHYSVVDEVATVRELIETSKISQPDIVLIDVDILKEDGWAMLHYIRTSLPLAALIITAQSDEDEYHTMAREAGALACISKKRLFESLMPALDTALNTIRYTQNNGYHTPPLTLPELLSAPHHVSLPFPRETGAWWKPTTWKDWVAGVKMFGIQIARGAPLHSKPQTDPWLYIQPAIIVLLLALTTSIVTAESEKTTTLFKVIILAAIAIFVTALIRYIRRPSKLDRTEATNRHHTYANSHQSSIPSEHCARHDTGSELS